MYTEQQKQFILDHHHKLTRREMAKRMNVSINYLTKWAIELTGKKKEGRKPRKAPERQREGYFYHDKELATI